MKQLSLLLLFFIIESSISQNAIQKILNEYKDSLINYGIVALVDDGNRIEMATMGWAYQDEPIKSNHRFCIGSCSKLYTATLIMKLQELKLLTINDSIHRYIPHHKFIDSAITIKQLLNHTSGIQDVIGTDLLNASLIDPYYDYSDNYILGLIDTIEFKKGSRFSYSNSNYMLLRKIIEVVADKPYGAVLDELIIAPLELVNTFPYHSKNIELLAHPIIGDQDLHSIPKIGVNTISVGIGNIVSSANDINTFIRSLFIDKVILNEQSLSAMTDFHSYKSVTMGLGVFEEKFGNRIVWGHTGRTVSYITYAFIDPESGSSFVLVNNNANDQYIDAIVDKVCKQE